MLSDRDLAGVGVSVLGSITVVALVADGNIWISRCLSLTNLEGPWSSCVNGEQRIKWSNQGGGAIGLEEHTSQNWTCNEWSCCCCLGVGEHCRMSVNSSSCIGGIISIILIGQRNGSQSVAIWLLGHLPAIVGDGGAVSVGAGNTDDVFITGINVLLGSNGTSRGIDHQVSSGVSATTSSDLERASSDGST